MSSKVSSSKPSEIDRKIIAQLDKILAEVKRAREADLASSDLIELEQLTLAFRLELIAGKE